MFDERLRVPFEKVEALLDQGEFVKTLLIDLLRYSIDKGDFVDLIDRLAELFEINFGEAQFIILTLSKPERVENIKEVVSNNTIVFLKMLAITYGSDLNNLRNYTFAENKLLVSESFQHPFDDKIGLTIKRLDKEEFYFEVDFLAAINLSNAIIQNTRISIEKKYNYMIPRDLWEEILNLRGSITLLHHKTKIERSESDGGEK